ncbi:Imm45 family immunity protein [Acinetobacter stercoris]|uniref:Immunity protein 45 domain-containing protein n=1 Tax=Acinetobacter stercoris TaxID=2126983 RepID=A0A2U3N2Y7_9GAMM|nr:Imm45 family immunity protein [Acinetobacter stercoris]SPL72038.1 hypothetical protein KPC_3216 [Acinetobacter stercoris]
MAKKFKEFNEDLERGLILRCKGQQPYEEYVDFMIVEQQEEQRKYGLMVISGYKAGLMYVSFPKEAISLKGFDLSYEWVKLNWSNWGYVDCALDDVYIIERLAPKSFDDF